VRIRQQADGIKETNRTVIDTTEESLKANSSALRDFTVDRRVWLLSSVAIVIGCCGAVLAVILLKAIAFCTNIFYFHRLSGVTVDPALSTWPRWLMLVVPIIGGLIVGIMARYGSDKIRGHGIPEAIESILLNGARVDPKVALLKPISAAISIGSGGPFGAEGPIIMTGGAFGSLVAQWMHLTDAERTTLLVAGAAAGMSATFSAPLAAILLAVELLLFEWRPRSLIPVAFASITAEVVRVFWLGAQPLFPMPAMEMQLSAHVALLALLLGMAVGVVGAGLSRLMYGIEDMFEHLPVHWMWWPAIGGVGIGIGGLFFPHGLGVGYDNIAVLLAGKATVSLLLGLIFAKSLMWAFSLGSGTSGGVLAPLLMIGGALGETAAHYAHATAEQQALWAAVGMGAMLSGSLGVPLTAAVFCLEITRSLPSALPVLLGCMAAYTVTSLIMPRSILTEKIARRGTHLTREYGTDPLETVSLREVMLELGEDCICDDENAPLSSKHKLPKVYAYADETSRSAVEKMATLVLDELAVVDRATDRVCGMVTLQDLLLGRRRAVHREHQRERIFARRHGER
jgi:chloride channel protein, CIC family